MTRPPLKSPAGRAAARRIYKSAIEAADPIAAVERHLRLSEEKGRGRVLSAGGRCYRLDSFENIFVLAAGKAACPMAKALEGLIGPYISKGLAVTKYSHRLRLKKIKVMEAGHPLPDVNGLKAADGFLKIADEATEKDLVICLFSGGASALLPSPPDGISLKDLKRADGLLINSGARIAEVNSVRKHLSTIKGGLLLKRLRPATVLTLLISDVPLNDPSTIASGPTAPDDTTFADALSLLERYRLLDKVPESVVSYLKKGARGRAPETLRPGDPALKGCLNIIAADNLLALSAAKERAEGLGYNTAIISSSLTGGVRETADFIASIIREIKRSGNPVKTPACILLGGETTVEVKRRGIGGRNQELALRLAIGIEGLGGVTVLSAGTDGTDGPTDAAGAFAGSRTIEKAAALGLCAEEYLARSDSYNFFKPLGGQFKTGPTRTNVMDIIVCLVE